MPLLRRKQASDQLAELIGDTWLRRKDRYSEERGDLGNREKGLKCTGSVDETVHSPLVCRLQRCYRRGTEKVQSSANSPALLFAK